MSPGPAGALTVGPRAARARPVPPRRPGTPFPRDLSTALVERDDFASGTSSRSTKLIHGGVRYLEKAVFNLDLGQLKLVFEALQVRSGADRKSVV